MNFAHFLLECEEALRSGRSAHIKSQLNELNTRDIADEFRLPLARVCRRTNEITIGLRLLTPRIRPEHALNSPPSVAENAEYAALLNLSGATAEALLILKDLDPNKAPEVHLFRAFCLMSEWDYLGVRESLQKYLAAPIDDYARFVGQVNLAAALLVTDDPRTRSDLERLILEAKERNHLRLLGNLLEMRAQLNLREKRTADVANDLDEAGALLAADVSLDLFFVRKWRTILAAVTRSDSEPLRILAQEAAKRGDWSTVREAELHSLKIDFDPALFNKLYFGTSSKFYRDRIVRELGRRPERENYIFGFEGGSVLKLASGDLDGLRIAPHVRRVLIALTKDFYRPQPVASMHSELFPGEYFNIQSSPNRVHQIIPRTRKWLNDHNVPAVVEFIEGGFLLKINGLFGIELDRVTPTFGENIGLQRLNQIFGREHFSPTQAREKLNLTRSSFQRLVNAALTFGVLQRFGHGSAITYRFNSES